MLYNIGDWLQVQGGGCKEVGVTPGQETGTGRGGRLLDRTRHPTPQRSHPQEHHPLFRRVAPHRRRPVTGSGAPGSDVCHL